jgi:hypothetical protein
MSYARMGWGGSDVYVFAHVAGGIACYCSQGMLRCGAEAMIKHLEEHIARGEHVPDKVIPRIRADMEAGEYDDPVETVREDDPWP